MYKLLLNFLFLQLFYTFVQAQTADSLVSFSDLKFRNNIEKQVYNHLKKAAYEDDVLNLFLFIKPYEDTSLIEHSEKIINDFIVQKVGKIKVNDEENMIKMLISLVNSSFLKMQKTNCNFQETIETGKYNCYTSAALYSIIFSRLKIPYQIKEGTNTIQLIAYPENKNISIAIEKEDKKCFEYAEHFRNKWTKSIYYAGTIPLEEFEKGYSEFLFNKYYFKSNIISQKQLAGILLCNLSLQLADESNVQEALYHMQKSYYLNTNERNQATLKYHIFNTLGKYNYENSIDFDKLLYLCRYRNLNDFEITNELICSEFLRFLSKQISLKNSLTEIENQSLFMLGKIKDSILLKELTYIYNYQISKSIVKDSIYNVDELKYLENAYKIKSNDPALKSLIFESLNKKIENIKEGTIVLGVVDNFILKFDYLEKSVSLRTIKINCYLYNAYSNFKNGMPLEGDENLKISEQLCKQYDIKPSIETIENTYLTAAKYYYKKGDKLKAKAYLQKGIGYAPDSKLIQDKLKLLQ